MYSQQITAANCKSAKKSINCSYRIELDHFASTLVNSHMKKVILEKDFIDKKVVARRYVCILIAVHFYVVLMNVEEKFCGN